MNDENQPAKTVSIFDSFLADCDDYRIVMVPLYAAVIADDMPGQHREMRFFALQEMGRYLHHYESLGYMQKLLCAIAWKKGAMILKTTSKADMQRILKPRCPHYNGNQLVPDPFSVPGEEMIRWSETSLKAPLMEEAYRRYMELFRQVLPEEFKQIFGKECPA